MYSTCIEIVQDICILPAESAVASTQTATHFAAFLMLSLPTVSTQIHIYFPLPSLFPFFCWSLKVNRKVRKDRILLHRDTVAIECMHTRYKAADIPNRCPCSVEVPRMVGRAASRFTLPPRNRCPTVFYGCCHCMESTAPLVQVVKTH